MPQIKHKPHITQLNDCLNLALPY